MTSLPAQVIRGVVRGRSIELSEDAVAGLVEGQAVSVMIVTEGEMPQRMRAAFGAWAEEGEEMEEFLEHVRAARQEVDRGRTK